MAYPFQEMTQAIPDHYVQKIAAARSLSDSGISQAYAPDAATKESPVERLMRAVSLLDEATNLSGRTTDALCGAQPTTAEKLSGEPSPSNLFATVSVAASRIERMAISIIDDMHRIQRVVG